VGDEGAVIGVDRFGASAPYQTLFQQYGLTAENIMQRAMALVRGWEAK